ncbi:LuxR family transcriptional regulator [Nonomuraea basaltis]|uniref:LuxR family transcriptional regulator n=1 Tax=Nonomuraea basaltis TaxID=2495887 RepID=UPI00110C6EF6|nr:LuxR family transcriptional regulator [Nonomuraea basaltis]TMR88585.1 hypothetical protein EJK15_65385 [Nonomuraea basaltis]
MGRSAQLAAIRTAIDAGGVVVVGPAGVGKSRLAAEAVRGMPGLVRILATVAAADIPLGAMAHLLPPQLPAGNVIGWAADAIGRERLLLVDDAHLLDAVSAVLVHHLVASGQARVLATVRSGERVPDAVTALWKDDLVPRLDLGPLGAEESDRLLADALGGHVEAITARRLWRISQGNVLFLRELVLAGQAGGALVERHGAWNWQGDISVTMRLSELIESRIGDITPGEREVLDFVAYGEPLSAGLLAGLAPADRVWRLEDRQLIVVSPENLSVRLAHPLYGEVIRAQCGVLRAREVLRKLAEAVEASMEAAGSRSREDVLRTAVWRLDSGTADDVASLMAACRTARNVRDLELAIRLGRAAVAAGGGVAAAALLASVLHYSDRYDEAETVLLAVAGQPMDDQVRAEFETVRALNLFMGLGRVAEACAALEAAAEAMTDREPRRGVLATRTSFEQILGRFAQCRRMMEEVRRIGPLTPLVAIGVSSMEANMLPYEGRGTQALAVVDETWIVIEGQPEGLPSFAVELLKGGAMAAVLTGDLAAARRYADLGYRLGEDHAGWNRAIAEFAARRAQVSRLGGRLAEAIRLCRQAIVRLRGRTIHGALCLAELAHAYALRGDAAAVQATMDLADELALLHVEHRVEFAFRLARPWALAAEGNVAGAIETAIETADAARGLPAYELFALHDVVRFGAPGLVADRLTGLEGKIDGLLAPLFARHARAGDDPKQLEAVSASFEGLGLLLHAADASAQAAAGYRRTGMIRAEHTAQTRAWTLARRCDGARTPALTGLATPELTTRQREIAHLAASGLSNREIADRLVISPRTVANTLVAVYERTGVNNRDDLAEILGVLD